MSTTEELWFLVAIGGFLLFMEGAGSSIASSLSRIFKRKKPFSEESVKVGMGLALIGIALLKLGNVV